MTGRKEGSLISLQAGEIGELGQLFISYPAGGRVSWVRDLLVAALWAFIVTSGSWLGCSYCPTQFLMMLTSLSGFGARGQCWEGRVRAARVQVCSFLFFQFSNQGSNLGFLHWKHEVLTSRLPGKSLFLSFWKIREPMDLEFSQNPGMVQMLGVITEPQLPYFPFCCRVIVSVSQTVVFNSLWFFYTWVMETL